MSTAKVEVEQPNLIKERALCAARGAQDKKSFAVTLIDVEGLCSYADIIMIASATSERQAAAIASGVEAAMRQEFGVKPSHREGVGASWVLLDFGDVLVHVFTEDARAYYDIDKLWATAPRIPVPAPSVGPTISETSPTALARRGRDD